MSNTYTDMYSLTLAFINMKTGEKCY